MCIVKLSKKRDFKEAEEIFDIYEVHQRERLILWEESWKVRVLYKLYKEKGKKGGNCKELVTVF